MIHSTIMVDSSEKSAMARTFTISDFSRLTGVHVNSLLYYEKLGILRPTRVDRLTGYRHYSLSQLRIVEAIQLCVRAGISLEAFASLQGCAGEGIIRYDRLLGGASESLRATIARARALLREVQAAQSQQRQGEAVAAGSVREVSVPAHRCLIRAVLPGENPDDAYFALLRAMGKARIRIGYDNGALIIRRDGVERRYLLRRCRAARDAPLHGAPAPAPSGRPMALPGGERRAPRARCRPADRRLRRDGARFVHGGFRHRPAPP